MCNTKDSRVHGTIDNIKARGNRGQGGVACIYRTYLQDKITVAKVDKYHRYIWLKITCSTRTYFLAYCYIPHRESVFYKGHGADPTDPFGDLGMDVCHFRALGEVMLMGDMNARIGDM